MAFGTKGTRAIAKPARRKAAATKTKSAPKVARRAAPTVAPTVAATQRADAPPDPPLGFSDGTGPGSPNDRGLAGAFDGDPSGVFKSVTGLIGSVGEKLARRNDDAASSESLLKTPKLLGMGAIAIVVIAGVLFWFMSGSDEMPAVQEAQRRTPSFTETDVIPASPQRAEVAIDVDALLKEARFARDAGQIINPVGSNAIDLFHAALQVAPENAIVTAEFDAVIARALGVAESALLESRLDDADIALQRVTGADADNPRLPFLTAQISQVRLRGYLDQARIATRENRFEDAALALSAAHELITTDDTEINAVADELSTARSAQQVDDVLVKANARLESGALLTPANDNARYYYELVLSADPGDTSARQGLNAIASKLVLQARTEVDSGNISDAEDLLAAARAIDPSNSELTATTVAVSTARAELATQQRRIEADRLETERLKAESMAVVPPDSVEQIPNDEAVSGTSGEPLADTTAAISIADNDVGVRLVDVTATGAVAEFEADTAARKQLTAEEVAIAVRNAAPVGVSSLARTRYVAPKYPRAAERRDQSGWVDITFTVAMDGTVKDIEVPKSEPGDVFVGAAMRAVEKWEFEPVVEGGIIVEKRAGLRLMFALE